MVLTRTKGILGMNARNLLYISKYNSTANKKFADDKIFTKNFLGSREIGVAKLYHVIKNHLQLTPEFFKSLPSSFVIKPNRGYGGGGILVIKEKTENSFINASKEKINTETLYRHCIDILEGKYSISGVHDQILFEETLESHQDFRNLTELGLPDIRIIVFNLVPILAMARIPTAESEGKANMELGAIGMGIDIGTGKTTGGAHYSNFVRKLPNGQSTIDFQIPFWEEILSTVSKIQHMTKIGFLGVDIVITKTGVKVLEINARAGLKIQIANKAHLRKRLEKVADIKVLTPEDGVKVAKTLFTQTTQTQQPTKETKPVIGIFESIILHGREKPKTITAKIDLLAEENTIATKFSDGPMIDISIAEKRIKLPVEKKKTIKDADLILSGKFLGDFYIDPNKKITNNPEILTHNLDEKVIKNIDEKICEIDSKIKLLSYLNPRNLKEQKEIFLSHQNVTPRFLYRTDTPNIEALKNDIRKIPKNVDHFLFPLYQQKIQNIENKINLIECRDSKEFGAASKALFGSVKKPLYQQALTSLNKKTEIIPDESEELDIKKTTEVLEEFLKTKKLEHWKIKILEDSVAEIQVTKKNTILLKKGATFKENRLKALLAHEIGTHVFRFENGKLQPLRILERGTANYLETEEGLAIYNQNQLGINLGEKARTPELLIIAIYMADKMSFRDLFQFLKSTHSADNETAWKLCIKSKRGLTNSENKTAFTKDLVYFSGKQKVEKFIKKEGKMSDLYVGKIHIEDLPLIQQIEGLKPPKFLL